MYHLDHNQDIVELLERLKALQAEYPAGLWSVRRHAFINLLSRYLLTPL